LFDPQNNPYTLAQQILGGRFDYPSPYWDSVGDPALDLIDRMLTVDPEKRITIDECLQHPWTTGHEIPPTQVVTSMSSIDSTEGLVGQFASQLDFSRRKPVRERTLLSSLNEIRVTRVIETQGDSADQQAQAVKVFEKNKGAIKGNAIGTAGTKELDAHVPANSVKKDNGKLQKNKKTAKEPGPEANRAPDEFMQMGGKGDEVLFTDDADSKYVSSGKAKEVQQVKERRKNGGKK